MDTLITIFLETLLITLLLLIFSIEDPLKKNATIGFINNFGQIPKQLFKKPHPAKKLGGNRSFVLDPTGITGFSSQDKFFFHYLDNLKPSLQPIKGKLIIVESFSRKYSGWRTLLGF